MRLQRLIGNLIPHTSVAIFFGSLCVVPGQRIQMSTIPIHQLHISSQEREVRAVGGDIWTLIARRSSFPQIVGDL